MRSMTELELQLLSEYLVGTGLAGKESLRFMKSVRSISKSLLEEWKE